MWMFEWFVSLLVYHYPCTYVAMYDDNRSIHITTLSGCQLPNIASETKIKQRSVSRLILHWSWSSVHVQVLIFSLWNSDIEGYGQHHPPSPVFLSGLRCCYKSGARCVFWPHICKVYKLFYVITNSLSHNKTNWDNGLKNEFNLEITPGRCPVLGTTKISNKEILIRRVWGWTVTWQSGHMC